MATLRMSSRRIMRGWCPPSWRRAREFRRQEPLGRSNETSVPALASFHKCGSECLRNSLAGAIGDIEETYIKIAQAGQSSQERGVEVPLSRLESRFGACGGTSHPLRGASFPEVRVGSLVLETIVPGETETGDGPRSCDLETKEGADAGLEPQAIAKPLDRRKGSDHGCENGPGLCAHGDRGTLGRRDLARGTAEGRPIDARA